MYNAVSCPVSVMKLLQITPQLAPQMAFSSPRGATPPSISFSQAKETSSSPVEEQLGSCTPALSTIPPPAARAGVCPHAISAKPAGRRMPLPPAGRRPSGAGSCVVAAGEGGGRNSRGGRRGPPQRRRACLRPSPPPPHPFSAPVVATALTGQDF